MVEASKTRYAVVTGGNRGIGFGICEQLAANGVVVVLTARDEKRGLEAVEKLKERGLSGRVLFHQLDVADQASVASLADLVKNQFGKLDILVNNAGISGRKLADNINGETLREMGFGKEGAERNWQEVMVETCELDEECPSINYYGAKRMIKAFVPLLKLSYSPRIVNVSSSMGLLKHVSNHWAKEILQDADNLTEEKIYAVLSKYLQDFKEGSLQTEGWPAFLSAYIMS